MNISLLSIPLSTNHVQVEKLLALQEAFALVCNTLAPVVRDTRCWSRVALHHMMYRTLREQFPLVGSQMVCNAIYSVSRTSRLIFQSEHSPFNVQHFPEKPLPLLQFLPTAPVYFDRHTVSIKTGFLSMYTLDGRMRFEVNLTQEDMLRFKTSKLHEVVLNRSHEQFVLNFSFISDGTGSGQEPSKLAEQQEGSYLPEYIVIDQEGSLSANAKTALLELKGPPISKNFSMKEPVALNSVSSTVSHGIELRAGTNFYVQKDEKPVGVQKPSIFSLKLSSSTVSLAAKTQVVPNFDHNPNIQMKLNINPIQKPQVTDGSHELPISKVES